MRGVASINDGTDTVARRRGTAGTVDGVVITRNGVCALDVDGVRGGRVDDGVLAVFGVVFGVRNGDGSGVRCSCIAAITSLSLRSSCRDCSIKFDRSFIAVDGRRDGGNIELYEPLSESSSSVPCVDGENMTD